MRKLSLPFGLLALLHLTTAHAYIGPGAGAGMLAVVLGILSTILFAFMGILWYPIKRLLKARKESARTATTPDRQTPDSEPGSGSVRDPDE